MEVASAPTNKCVFKTGQGAGFVRQIVKKNGQSLGKAWNGALKIKTSNLNWVWKQTGNQWGWHRVGNCVTGCCLLLGNYILHQFKIPNGLQRQSSQSMLQFQYHTLQHVLDLLISGEQTSIPTMNRATRSDNCSYALVVFYMYDLYWYFYLVRCLEFRKKYQIYP